MKALNMLPMLLSYLWATFLRPVCAEKVKETTSPIDNMMLESVDSIIQELVKKSRKA